MKLTPDNLSKITASTKLIINQLAQSPNISANSNFKMINLPEGQIRVVVLPTKKGKNPNPSNSVAKQVTMDMYQIYNDKDFGVFLRTISPSQQQGADRNAIGVIQITPYK